MSIDANQALIAQFSGFISSKQISKEEWETISMEFGVYDIAKNTDRFFRSWYFGDEDKANRTAKFLKSVHDEDKDLAIAIMNRVYQKVDGAAQDELDEYPMVQQIEEGVDEGSLTTPNIAYHSDPFINVSNSPESFYPGLISEINTCYQAEAYNATLVLSRKLLENALIETLRSRFAMEEGMHLFFNEDRKQFVQFGGLIDNFKEEIDHFKPLSDAVDMELINKLHEIRYQGNAGAHSIEKKVTKSDVDEYSEMIEETATVLFSLRRKSFDEDNVTPSSATDEAQSNNTELDKELFQTSDSEILSEYSTDVDDLFRFSNEGELYITDSEKYSLKQKIRIYFLAHQYGAETELVDSPTVTVNELIEEYNLDMATVWQIIGELDCLRDINRKDGEFEFDVQKLPEILPEITDT
ncbi:DUF4145 domain-containing protein [Halopiger aswanensis]|uniref:Uncharacterized protein DUF4145 n=1 Tax=Halopiger aswanensis TaxID=148449 RepID=A0A3R7DX65_9EURY|nr:DUF4145 domain-containing protein [Halopiger aswanensis]RKD89084.1 uncharacterized protein DUF4145 [Halopiger aswanensis]